MKKVLLVSTGGTISSLRQPAGSVVPELTGQDFLRMFPEVESLAAVSVIEFSRVPSHYLDLDDLLRLSKTIEDALSTNGYEGVVITMGTNAMEEAAYCLDLLLGLDVPVVITGAMRSPEMPSSDAEMNLYNSVVAASSDSLKGAGCVVCMAGEIHHARYVTKTNTVSLSSFQSPGVGPIGVVRGKGIVLYTRIAQREHIRPQHIGARVDLVRYGIGMDGSLLQAALDLGAQGIVVEAWGGGHLTPSSIPAIEQALARGVPVVLTSRCMSGELLLDTYGFEGSEIHLRRIGVIFASGLIGVKARIKLIFLLGMGEGMEAIRLAFEGP